MSSSNIGQPPDGMRPPHVSYMDIVFPLMLQSHFNYSSHMSLIEGQEATMPAVLQVMVVPHGADAANPIYIYAIPYFEIIRM